MRAMIIKEFRELRRDKRTLAMLVVLPLVLLLIFGFAANFTIESVSTTVVGSGTDRVVATMKANPSAAEFFDVVETDTNGDAASAREALRNDRSDVAIVAGSGKPTIYIDGSNLFAAQSAQVSVARMGDAVESQILYNPELSTSWVMVPALVGLILTFIGMLVTSIGLVKERENGTIEQLAVMPLKPAAVILGKIVPYFVLACVDMALITVLGQWIFGVPFNGSFALFALGAAVFLFVVLGLGVLVSTISKTTGQAIQTAIFFLLPQILLSGFIFPLDAMAVGVRWIGYLLPLTYFTKISQGIMLRGADIGSLWPSLVVLAIMAVVIFTAAVLRFRRSISPAKSALVTTESSPS